MIECVQIGVFANLYTICFTNLLAIDMSETGGHFVSLLTAILWG